MCKRVVVPFVPRFGCVLNRFTRMQFSLLVRGLCDKVPNAQVASIRHEIPVAAKYRFGNLT